MSDMSKLQRICTRCVLNGSFPRISFDKEGVCSVCRRHEQLWAGWKSGLPQRWKELQRICNDARNKHREFDALVPLSGGKDSMFVLHKAVKELGLHCIAYTLDNGYLSKFARKNVERACRKLGVEQVYYRLNPHLINRLYALFIRKTGYFCSICMRAIAMASLHVADMYRVPLVLRGSSLRTELPLCPEMFQYGSISHIRNVLRGEPIVADCRRLLYGGRLRRRIGHLFFLLSGKKRLRSYGWLNLADYMEWDYKSMLNTIRRELGWQSPPDRTEHIDCLIQPVAKYLHNRRFPGAEQRRLTLARSVMVGNILREEALRRLEEEPEEQCPESVLHMFLQNLGMSREEFDRYIDMGPRHLLFQSHNEPVKAIMKLLKAVYTKEYSVQAYEAGTE